MSYKKLWSDMHSNIHHNQMNDLEQWFNQAKEVMDFWPIAYYPMYMRRNESGAPLEDMYPEDEINADWEKIREFTEKTNAEGWPMFMGYEWQGCGFDGDHNVFFLDNKQPMVHPMRYSELRDFYKDTEAIAIPHHVAYQLNSRGKNWDTHDEAFSPFAEVYSSHGCSENDTGPYDMERHLHMGPRTGETCYERGLEKGLKVGCIASGDNHNAPGVCDHGMMCVLAEDSSKEKIWEGLKARRVYGVSRTRMDIDFTINDVPMGGEVKPGESEMKIKINAGDAIDRVEVIKDNIVEKMIVHSGTWEHTQPHDKFRFKFALEFGWGPNPNFYKDILPKLWNGSLEVPGRLLSIQKCWNNYGQKISEVTEKSCRFDLTTYMTTTTGHWMGPSTVQKQSFICEIEGTEDDILVLTIDGKKHNLLVRDIMHSSKIIAQYDESIELAEKTFGDIQHYRDDLIWHNAYKTRIRQAVPEKAYTLDETLKMNMVQGSNYRLRVWLRNGDTAWVSPIFCRA